jgi:hypothetical protein
MVGRILRFRVEEQVSGWRNRSSGMRVAPFLLSELSEKIDETWSLACELEEVIKNSAHYKIFILVIYAPCIV